VSVSLEEVHRFARMARLRLDPGEAERLRGDLSRILQHVDGLADLADDAPTPSAFVEPPAPAASEVPMPEGPDPLAHGPEGMAPEWREGLIVVPSPEGVEPEGP
jgi:hypothetical protein